jgi:hypothetical protein
MLALILTPEARAALTLQLADARSAYHSLMTGQQARVIVDQNGERVEFMAANRGNLYNYILSLEAQLAVVPAASRVLGPARFIF